MLLLFFSVKRLINSVNIYLIANIAILFPLLICCKVTSSHGNKDEITNNFPKNETQDAIRTQNVPFNENNLFLYGDYNYLTNIGAVLFSPLEWEMGPALIRMNTDETLLLQFDDLDADFKAYYYTIIHCDAYWQPSQLMEFEYIDGFHQDQIVNYSSSINTIVPYTHYSLEFPNANMKPMLSGNYILKVFVDGNPDHVAFTRRFMIFESLLTVQGSARLANLVAQRDTHHQIAFNIDVTPYHVSNPYQDLKVVILQNGRWDNAIKGITPRMIRGNQLIFDHEDQLFFEGGNEFRRFDLRSLRYVTERVGDISGGARHWDVFLLPDQRRAFRRYTSDNDINGRFHIETADARSQDLEADYAWVHFSLALDAPVATGSVHLMGQLTQWGLSSESQMNYNYRLGQYESRLLLKQGLYNYWYVFLEEGARAADVCFFEGCHSQTENEYTVFVYHRPPGSLNDKLVGLGNFSSSNLVRR